MNDERKTKTQLVQELDMLRQRCAELETIKAEWERTSEALPRLIDLNEIIQNMVEIMRDHPEHIHGRVHWSDRVFRRCEGDDVKTFNEFFARYLKSPDARPP